MITMRISCSACCRAEKSRHMLAASTHMKSAPFQGVLCISGNCGTRLTPPRTLNEAISYSFSCLPYAWAPSSRASDGSLSSGVRCSYLRIIRLDLSTSWTVNSIATGQISTITSAKACSIVNARPAAQALSNSVSSSCSLTAFSNSSTSNLS